MLNSLVVVLSTEGLYVGINDLDGISTCDGIDVGISPSPILGCSVGTEFSFADCDADAIIEIILDGKVVVLGFIIGLSDGRRVGAIDGFENGWSF